MRCDARDEHEELPGTQRLDKWLWFARFCKSRAVAAKLVRSGKVRLNRTKVGKTHQLLRAGDVLTFALGREVRVVRVLALGERRGPATEARTLYEDLTRPGDDSARERVPENGIA